MGATEAYFLGLLFSDGCVCHTTKNRYITNLGMNDKDVIINFKKFMKAKNKISKTYKRYEISFCSKYLFNKLNHLGCLARKSNILSYPKIPVNLIWPFLLGVYDGDGSLSLNKTINSWKMSIGTGSLKFSLWLKNFLKVHNFRVSYEKRKLKNRKNFYNIVLTGITAKAFLSKLYSSSIKYKPMKRKFIIYKKLNKLKLRNNMQPFDWELDYLKNNKSNKKCLELIKNDPRNYGWIRSSDSIAHFRKRYF